MGGFLLSIIFCPVSLGAAPEAGVNGDERCGGEWLSFFLYIQKLLLFVKDPRRDGTWLLNWASLSGEPASPPTREKFSAWGRGRESWKIPKRWDWISAQPWEWYLEKWTCFPSWELGPESDSNRIPFVTVSLSMARPMKERGGEFSGAPKNGPTTAA